MSPWGRSETVASVALGQERPSHAMAMHYRLQTVGSSPLNVYRHAVLLTFGLANVVGLIAATRMIETRHRRSKISRPDHARRDQGSGCSKHGSSNIVRVARPPRSIGGLHVFRNGKTPCNINAPLSPRSVQLPQS